MFFSLPNDIKSHIFFFIKTSSANSIISSWKRYISHKKFTIYSIYSLPRFNSFIDNDLIYSVVFEKTYFFFKKLYNITTGNESYLSDIYNCFYLLAVSIDDFEWITGCNASFKSTAQPPSHITLVRSQMQSGSINTSHNYYYYEHNKFICISISLKFKWNNILHLLQ